MTDNRRPPIEGADWRVWLAGAAFVLAGVWMWSTLWLSAAGLVGYVVPGVDVWLISSGSMEPAITAGDLVLTSPPKEDEVLAHPSVITFEMADRPVTHRIVETVASSSGLAYRTKGDANPNPDSSLVAADDLLGVGRVVIPYAGLPLHWASNGGWWRTLLFGFTIGIAAWAQKRSLQGPGRHRQPGKVAGQIAALGLSLRRGRHRAPGIIAGRLATTGLLVAAISGIGASLAVFTATAAGTIDVAAGTGFRPDYDTEILSDGPDAYWRLGDTTTSGSFTDDFTTFSGWIDYLSGTVQAANGTQPDGTNGGLVEKINNNDPNGGWKDLGISVDDWTLETWIYRPSSYPGGAVDRIGIESSAFDGYGLAVNHGNNTMWIERRNGGLPSGNITGSININPPEDVWYRMVMTKTGSNLSLEMYDDAGILVASGSGTDTTYTTGFSRVVIHGGHNYLIDDLTVTGTQPLSLSTPHPPDWTAPTSSRSHSASPDSSAQTPTPRSSSKAEECRSPTTV